MGSAASRSSTECCRRKIVEIEIRKATMPNTIFHGNVEKWRLFHAANMTDMEPTTWSEGQTLVLVSKL